MEVPIGTSDNLQTYVITQLQIPCIVIHKIINMNPFICRVPKAGRSLPSGTSDSTIATARSDPPPNPYTSSRPILTQIFVPPPDENPSEYTAEYFDIVFSFAKADQDIAQKIIKFLEGHVRYGGNKKPKICVIDEENQFPLNRSRLQSAKEAMDRSTYMTFIFTKNYFDDQWPAMLQETCFLESIENPAKKWCFIPLYLTSKDELDFEIPFGVNTLKGFDFLCSFNPRATSIDDIDFHNIRKENLNKHWLQNWATMLDNKAHIRQRKEQEHYSPSQVGTGHN